MQVCGTRFYLYALLVLHPFFDTLRSIRAGGRFTKLKQKLEKEVLLLRPYLTTLRLHISRKLVSPSAEGSSVGLECWIG